MNKLFFTAAFFLVSCVYVNADYNPAVNNILNRKSVRRYTSQKVEKEKIDAIMKAGMAAPSAVNLQPWEIIVVDDKKILNEISQRHPYAAFVKNAAFAIVVCGNSKTSPDFWMQDCCAVSENMLLAAESLGLGAVWCAIYPDKERIAAISAVLKLPDYIIPLNVIPVGYPKGENLPKQKYNPSKIHINYWNE